MTDDAAMKSGNRNFQGYYYFSGGQWRYYASGLTPRGNPLSAFTAHEAAAGKKPDVAEDCPRCRKPLALCICDSIEPIRNRTSLLILQHPQEQDRALGTATLTALHFDDAVL